MPKYELFIYIIILCFQCNASKKDTNCGNEDISYVYELRKLYLQNNLLCSNGSICNEKMHFITEMLLDSMHLHPVVSIDNIKTYQRTNIVHLGMSEIIEITLGGAVPTVECHTGYLIHSLYSKVAFYLPADEIRFVKRQNRDESNYIATIPKWRGNRAYLYVLDFCDDIIYVTFATYNTNIDPTIDRIYAIYVFKDYESCMDYENDSLSIINTDINKDNFLDIQLIGKAVVHCKVVNDDGYTAPVNPPDTVALNIIYLYNPKQNTWILEDSSMVDVFKYNISPW
jgi:hypothetical protein